MKPKLAALLMAALAAPTVAGAQSAVSPTSATPTSATPTTSTPTAGAPAAPDPAVSAAEAVVEAQLEAYNRRDLEGFLSFYADDAVLLDYPDKVTQTGKEQMRARYTKRFANPNIRATVVKRIVFGNFVVDHEQITAPPQPGMIEAVAIYEVREGKIVRVTFLAK